MKAIVTYRKFHDISIFEVVPEVYLISEYETPEKALRRIWEDYYNGALSEAIFLDDPLDEENCWIEDDVAQIAWMDGDIKEFYIVTIEQYR